MATRNTIHGLADSPGKVEPADRGQDARKGAQDNERTATQSNPPVHTVPTQAPQQFLLAVPPETPLEKLGELWERWNDDSEQADLSGWSK